MILKDEIIKIILSIPGLGTVDHVIASGLDMDDIEKAANEILELIKTSS